MSCICSSADMFVSSNKFYTDYESIYITNIQWHMKLLLLTSIPDIFTQVTNYLM